MAIKKAKINPNAGLASVETMRAADIVMRNDEAVKDIIAVPRHLIAFHENNDYRILDNDETIHQLADAIKRQGLLDNLVVVKRASRNAEFPQTKYVLLSGERRLRAINLLCESDIEMQTRYATVPCNLIPESFFTLSEEQRLRLHEKGIADTEIRDIQELLLIDEANLQRRGGVGDEVVQRKAAYRYSRNLSLIFSISQAEADEITKQICGQNERNTVRNLKIERNLISSAKMLLDKSLLGKKDAEILASLPTAAQERVGDALAYLAEVTGTRADSPSQEYSVAKSKVGDILSIRNAITREKELDEFCSGVESQAEEIRKNKVLQKKTDNVITDAAEKYRARVVLLRSRIQSLSKPYCVQKMISLGIDKGENNILEIIDASIEDLEKLKVSLMEEAQKNAP